MLIENFRPGVMEEWGIGPAHLQPELIYTRISGYGQVGALVPAHRKMSGMSKPAVIAGPNEK